MLVQLLPKPVVTPELQSVLDAEKQPAILLGRDYRILATNRAYVEHYGTQPKLGEDACYRVSHGYSSPCDQNGESCPLRASLDSRKPQRVFHVHHHPDGPEHVDVELRPLLGDDGEISAFIEVITRIDEASAHPGGSFVGRSEPFKHVVELIRRGAPSEVPILLTGESGTGKELAARAIHDASDRRGGPFVPVECSGLSEQLFESEFFGHVRGAFTGALSTKPGLVEAATGGTLFLDEIGDVPRGLQVKLLRLLESGTYRRVGEVEQRRADFRLVCATHHDLLDTVAVGRFRRDLFYRINVFPIALPALRARREDLPLLCDAMLRDHHKTLAPAALEVLLRYDFPGNIRELRNILERAVLLCDGPDIQPQHLPAELASTVSAGSVPSGEWPWGNEVLPLDEVERRYLLWAEETCARDRRELARLLGVSERTLYRKLRAAGGEAPDSES